MCHRSHDTRSDFAHLPPGRRPSLSYPPSLTLRHSSLSNPRSVVLIGRVPRLPPRCPLLAPPSPPTTAAWRDWSPLVAGTTTPATAATESHVDRPKAAAAASNCQQRADQAGGHFDLLCAEPTYALQHHVHLARNGGAALQHRPAKPAPQLRPLPQQHPRVVGLTDHIRQTRKVRTARRRRPHRARRRAAASRSGGWGEGGDGERQWRRQPSSLPHIEGFDTPPLPCRVECEGWVERDRRGVGK